MRRFGDFVLIGEKDLLQKGEENKKINRSDESVDSNSPKNIEKTVSKAKEILEKAKVKKEKLAAPNEFMNDPKNEAPGVKKDDHTKPKPKSYPESNPVPHPQPKPSSIKKDDSSKKPKNWDKEEYELPPRPQSKPRMPLKGYDEKGRMIGEQGVKDPLYPEDKKMDTREHKLHADFPDSKKTSNVEKFDELVSASTSPGGGGATGKSMDQSGKKMDKDNAPHKKDSPEDKAHDVVEEGEKVPDAAAEVKGDPKEMFEHLRSYREMQAQGKGDEWKRSPDNAKMGKSGVSDPMLMSLNQMKKEMDKRCWEGYEPTPGKKAYEKGSCQPTKKNDPAVSGTKVESQQSGEIGNRSKAKDDSISPLQSEPKQMIAEEVGDKYAKGSMQKSEGKKHLFDYKGHSVHMDDWPRVSERMNRYTIKGPTMNAEIAGLPSEHDLKIGAIKEEIDRKSSVKKSMKEGGGVQWTEADALRGLAFSAGSRVGATEGPNLDAQPLVKKDQNKQEKSREVPLHRVLEDMDDSKVKT